MGEGVMSFLSFALCVLFTWTIIRALLPLARGTQKQNTRTKLPPGPAPLPVIGNLFQLGNKPHKSMAELAKTHGPIMTLRFPPNKTAVVISSAAMAKQALQKQDASFSSHRTVPDCLRACGHDAASVVWLPASQKWRNLHKICNYHIFTARVLDGNRDLRRQKVQELLAVVGESCSSGSGIAVGKLAFMTALNLLSDTVLSRDWVDLRSDAAQELKEAAWGIMEEVGRPNLADYFPVLSGIDLQGIRRRLTAHFRIFFEVFDSAIEQRINVREQQPGRRRRPNTDVLDILIDIVHDGTDLSVNDMRHLLLDLFIAGSETTSSTVEWAMVELLRNPTTLARVHAEMEQTIGKGNPEVEEEDVARLPYLQAVVKETFRLHPAVPLLLPRRVDAEVEICGYNIPKDTQVLVNAWAIGRDPETWEDPNAFRPERFMELDMDVKGQNFELIPFGAGRRRCPGLPLAVRMVHLMLGSLIHAFKWKLEDGVTAEAMDMEEMFGLTLQKAQPLVAIPLHH